MNAMENMLDKTLDEITGKNSADCPPAQCSASAWTVHWTSEDGMRPCLMDFTNANKAGKFVSILLKNGRSAVSIMRTK